MYMVAPLAGESPINGELRVSEKTCNKIQRQLPRNPVTESGKAALWSYRKKTVPHNIARTSYRYVEKLAGARTDHQERGVRIPHATFCGPGDTQKRADTTGGQ